MSDLRTRFPGLDRAWARFDGPAGTQVVDTSVEATRAWQTSGNNANSHGAFAAADACDHLIGQARRMIGRLLGADPAGVMFGPSTTNNIMHLTRALGRDLGPGDEIVCTQLDHDSNVAPWLLVAADTGATVRMARLDTVTGRMAVEAVVDLVSERTRWVAVTGASNAIGTIPDIAAITSAARAAGARVAVDGVHLTPHRPVDVAAIGCDVYSTSAYKWYGPHVGITWVEPDLLAALRPYKVRPAPDSGPGRLELGTPAWELLAGVIAAADFMITEGVDELGRHERDVFAGLMEGLLAVDQVTVIGPRDLAERTPTVAFTVADHSSEDVARALAAERVAVWAGDYYASELMAAYGLAPDGAVRAGVVAYIDHDDVARLLAAVRELVTR